LPRSAFRLSGSPPGVLNQRWLPVKSGATPSRGSFASATPLVPRGRDREARRGAQPIQPAGDRVRRLQAAGGIDQRGRQVLGDRRLEAHVEVRRHRDAGEDEHERQRALQAGAAPGGAQALHERPPAERQREQHERRPQREGEPDGHRARRSGADGDDRGQDRPGARRVDEAQRGADEQARGEPVAAPARAQARQARQRRLQPRGHRRQRMTMPKPMRTITASVR
jgi:hypothetical protein